MEWSKEDEDKREEGSEDGRDEEQGAVTESSSLALCATDDAAVEDGDEQIGQLAIPLFAFERMCVPESQPVVLTYPDA